MPCRLCHFPPIVLLSGTVHPYQPGGWIQEAHRRKNGHGACDLTDCSWDQFMRPHTWCDAHHCLCQVRLQSVMSNQHCWVGHRERPRYIRSHVPSFLKSDKITNILSRENIENLRLRFFRRSVLRTGDVELEDMSPSEAGRAALWASWVWPHTMDYESGYQSLWCFNFNILMLNHQSTT